MNRFIHPIKNCDWLKSTESYNYECENGKMCNEDECCSNFNSKINSYEKKNI